MFIVNVDKEYSEPGKLTCGVPLGSILSPLLLYADDSCLVFNGKNIRFIKENLNRIFNSLCDWFIDNKLSIHFGEDKTKSMVFGTRKRQNKYRRN